MPPLFVFGVRVVRRATPRRAVVTLFKGREEAVPLVCVSGERLGVGRWGCG